MKIEYKPGTHGDTLQIHGSNAIVYIRSEKDSNNKDFFWFADSTPYSSSFYDSLSECIHEAEKYAKRLLPTDCPLLLLQQLILSKIDSCWFTSIIPALKSGLKENTLLIITPSMETVVVKEDLYTLFASSGDIHCSIAGFASVIRSQIEEKFSSVKPI